MGTLISHTFVCTFCLKMYIWYDVFLHWHILVLLRVCRGSNPQGTQTEGEPTRSSPPYQCRWNYWIHMVCLWNISVYILGFFKRVHGLWQNMYMFRKLNKNSKPITYFMSINNFTDTIGGFDGPSTAQPLEYSQWKLCPSLILKCVTFISIVLGLSASLQQLNINTCFTVLCTYLADDFPNLITTSLLLKTECQVIIIILRPHNQSFLYNYTESLWKI